MHKNRLEAFSDGVIAIIITIMVLELKVPEGATFESLFDLHHVIVAYVMSFIYLGIYWNNHHHLIQAAERVNGAALWANLHLLFWLSLFPFATAWLGETGLAPHPAAFYGMILLAAALAYTILTRVLIRHHGAASLLARSIGWDLKGLASAGLYLAGIGVAFVAPLVAVLIYAGVGALWLIPDRRIERTLSRQLTENPANSTH